MNLLIISHEYPPIGGGGANACFFLAREMAQMGNQVTIITAQYNKLPARETTPNGVSIYRVKCRRKSKESCNFPEMFSYLVSAWNKASQLVRTEKFDKCLIFFGIPSGPIGYLLKRKYQLPYMIRFGGGDIPGFQDRFNVIYKLISPFLKIIWNNADDLVANSMGLKKLAEDFYDKKYINIIYNGIDSDRFYPSADKSSSPQKDIIEILFVSRLIERKGLQFIIPKLKYIQEKSFQTIHMTIVGDGPYRENLEKLALDSDCQDMIRFEGQKDKYELLSYYQKADIFILPSKKEGMPNVVLEAMACGLPIVMTPCEGSKELVTNNGFISPITDFADSLATLCADSNLRKCMGNDSLLNIKEHFQWRYIAERYMQLLNQKNYNTENIIMEKLKYNKKFYTQQRKSNLSSAEIIVPIVLELLRTDKKEPFSVIDLGCASGNWLSIFKKCGCTIRGVDGGEVPDSLLMIDKSEFTLHDFRTRYKDDNTYSLAMSLEVAEHIPESNADEFVETLTQLSDVILFSAAIPFQRGKEHVNEQYPSYWVKKFKSHGFQALDVIREKVWNNKSVRGFYAQNMFLYVKEDSESYEKFKDLAANTPQYDIIHPEVWEQVNHFKPVEIMDKLHDNRLVSWIYYKFFKNK